MKMIKKVEKSNISLRTKEQTSKQYESSYVGINNSFYVDTVGSNSVKVNNRYESPQDQNDNLFGFQVDTVARNSENGCPVKKKRKAKKDKILLRAEAGTNKEYDPSRGVHSLFQVDTVGENNTEVKLIGGPAKKKRKPRKRKILLHTGAGRTKENKPSHDEINNLFQVDTKGRNNKEVEATVYIQRNGLIHGESNNLFQVDVTGRNNEVGADGCPIYFQRSGLLDDTAAPDEEDKLLQTGTSGGKCHCGGEDEEDDDDDEEEEEEKIEEEKVEFGKKPPFEFDFGVDEEKGWNFKRIKKKKKNEFHWDNIYLDFKSRLRKGTEIDYNKTHNFINVDEVLKKSAITPGFEKLEAVPPYFESEYIRKKKRKEERDRTKGRSWFNMPATEVTDEVRHDLEVVQMRSVLDPKHFYKKNDMDVLPKYFQVGRVQDDAVDFYNNRVPKKERKKTLVDELLANAQFQTYTKKRYKEIIEGHRKTQYKEYARLNKLKRRR